VSLQVWVGRKKIGAVGVRFSHGVSSHGLALNVCPDLSWYNLIVPCGDADARVTSMSLEFDGRVSVGDVEHVLIRHFLRALRRENVETVEAKQLAHECNAGPTL
jgi:lipoyl(octanoyl) transferase